MKRGPAALTVRERYSSPDLRGIVFIATTRWGLPVLPASSPEDDGIATAVSGGGSGGGGGGSSAAGGGSGVLSLATLLGAASAGLASCGTGVGGSVGQAGHGAGTRITSGACWLLLPADGGGLLV